MCERCERIEEKLVKFPVRVTHAAIAIGRADEILHIEGYDHEPTAYDLECLCDKLQKDEDIAMTDLVPYEDYDIIKGERTVSLQ